MNKGKTLLLSAEDGLADTIVPRLIAMGADMRQITAVPKPFTLNPEGLRGLDELLEKHRPALVIIDPLVAYMGGDVDLHRANEVRELTSQLGELAERHHCAMLAIRHWKKSGGDQAIYKGIGSIDIAAAARSILAVVMTPELKHALCHVKSNVGPHGGTLLYELEPPKTRQGAPTFKWTGTSMLTAEELANPPKAPGRPASTAKTAEEFLRDALAGKHSITAGKIIADAERAGINERTLTRVRKHLKIVSEKRGKDWWWSLPQRGKK